MEENQTVLQYCRLSDGLWSELAMDSKLEQLQGFSCESELGFDSVSLLPVACLSYTHVHTCAHRHILTCLTKRLNEIELQALARKKRERKLECIT